MICIPYAYMYVCISVIEHQMSQVTCHLSGYHIVCHMPAVTSVKYNVMERLISNVSYVCQHNMKFLDVLNYMHLNNMGNTLE